MIPPSGLPPSPAPLSRPVPAVAVSGGVGRRTPLVAVAQPRTSPLAYAMAALDFNSGVSCGTMLGALGWEGDTRLTVREVDDHVVFTTDPGGEHNVVGLRRVRLPSSSRRRLAVRRGDQLLLIADSSSATLTLYSPAVVADVVAAAHRAVGGATGERRAGTLMYAMSAVDAQGRGLRRTPTVPTPACAAPAPNSRARPARSPRQPKPRRWTGQSHSRAPEP